MQTDVSESETVDVEERHVGGRIRSGGVTVFIEQAVFSALFQSGGGKTYAYGRAGFGIVVSFHFVFAVIVEVFDLVYVHRVFVPVVFVLLERDDGTVGRVLYDESAAVSDVVLSFTVGVIFGFGVEIGTEFTAPFSPAYRKGFVESIIELPIFRRDTRPEYYEPIDLIRMK